MNENAPMNIREVQPGDTVIFENRGMEFGGVVWRSPSSGSLIAGDTYLTLKGEWIATDEHVKKIIPSRYRAGADHDQ